MNGPNVEGWAEWSSWEALEQLLAWARDIDSMFIIRCRGSEGAFLRSGLSGVLGCARKWTWEEAREWLIEGVIQAKNDGFGIEAAAVRAGVDEPFEWYTLDNLCLLMLGAEPYQTQPMKGARLLMEHYGKRGKA